MTEFKPNSTAYYPGHVPPKHRASLTPVIGTAIVSLIGVCAGMAIGSMGTTETVTHIDQPAATCEATQ